MDVEGSSREPKELQILKDVSALRPALTPSREQQALYSFFSDYGILDRSAAPQNPKARGFLEVIADVYKEASPDSHLTVALRATSLANLANRYNSPELQAQSRKIYGEALGMTNAALRDRRTAVLNETLTTVHVLGVYEVRSPMVAKSALPISKPNHG